MLTSHRNPRVKSVIKLRDRRHRDRQRRFIIEGRRELERAVTAGFPVQTVFYCAAFHAGRGEAELLQRCAAAGVECQPTSAAVFEKLSYRRTPDGLLGVAAIPELGLDELAVAEPALLLVAAAIEKPGNLGAMLRAADATGTDGVLLADPATDAFNPNVVRASVGTLFSVPLAAATAPAARQWLAAHGLRTMIASPEATLDYTEADFGGGVAIVVGSEHAGLDADWLSGDYQGVRIPMAGRGDSLNAAMAATVLLFEARRQRSA